MENIELDEKSYPNRSARIVDPLFALASVYHQDGPSDCLEIATHLRSRLVASGMLAANGLVRSPKKRGRPRSAYTLTDAGVVRIRKNAIQRITPWTAGEIAMFFKSWWLQGLYLGNCHKDGGAAPLVDSMTLRYILGECNRTHLITARQAGLIVYDIPPPWGFMHGAPYESMVRLTKRAARAINGVHVGEWVDAKTVLRFWKDDPFDLMNADSFTAAVEPQMGQPPHGGFYRKIESKEWRMEEDFRFWIGWIEPGEDSRPVRFPPDERVKNYWESGCGETDGKCYITMCAVVDAKDEKHAQEVVRRDWRPMEFRFCSVHGKASDGWTPEPTRFAWHNGGLGVLR